MTDFIYINHRHVLITGCIGRDFRELTLGDKEVADKFLFLKKKGISEKKVEIFNRQVDFWI